MIQIEPNVLALCWFALLWSICCLCFFQLVGMYPLGSRPDETPASSSPIVLGSTLLWLILLVGTCLFAIAELRWTSTVIVAGILFLFIPDLLQIIPQRLRNGWTGLLATSLSLVLALALLASVAIAPIKSLL